MKFLDITLGNVITILTIVGSGLLLWARQKFVVENLMDRMAKAETELDSLTKVGIMTALNQHERRLVGLESAVADLAKISVAIEYIKDEVHRLQRNNS